MSGRSAGDQVLEDYQEMRSFDLGKSGREEDDAFDGKSHNENSLQRKRQKRREDGKST